ncbi:hypothetical protein VM1G_00063 [Cytospora mali]|uniref:Uncharacterized protein n=1 Tax=Cytospora mali TaxID=578113 RepID=A0A194VNF2_CYTMA|nr:hypothetical protein VM1G_00063 [Valsa mali]
MRSIIVPIFMAGIAFAQNTTITPTAVQTVVDLFLGAKRQSNYSFEGSVVWADNTATTYEIRCNSGALNLPGFPTTTCDLKDPPWTVTDGPSTMVGVLSTSIQNVTAVLAETCAVDGRTAAYCNYTFVGDSVGRTTSTSYTTIITGDMYVEYPVTITAGAEKFAAATATSSPSDTIAATTGTPSTGGTRPSVVRTGTLGTIVLAAIAFTV